MILLILQESYSVLAEAAPYILFGTIVAGVLKTVMGSINLAKWLETASLKSVVLSSLAGVPLPLCSCSVLPVAMELRRNKASRGATASFLVSTPQTGVDSILLTVGIINPIFAVARVIAAFVAGTIAGVVQNWTNQSDEGTLAESGSCCSTSCCSSREKTSSDESLSIWRRLYGGQYYAFTDLLKALAPYYVIGILATGVVLAFLPDGILEDVVGGGVAGMILVCFVGVAVYICASGATPLAAALIAKGMSPGTALVLLMAGPATSLASIVAVRSMLGNRGLIFYLASIMVTAVGLGLALDWVIIGLGLSFTVSTIEAVHEHMSLLSHLVAAAVGLAIVYWTVMPYLKRFAGAFPGPGSPHLSSEKSP